MCTGHKDIHLEMLFADDSVLSNDTAVEWDIQSGWHSLA